MSPELATPSLEELVIRWAAERLGFDSRALRLERLLAAARAEAKRLGSVNALGLALGAGDPQAEAALVAAATVGETYFFRQHEHFDLLNELALPPSGRLMAWSAGCATGEETYSLAGVLRQRFGLEADKLTVWGTDINAKALDNAKAALYGRWSWRSGAGLESQAQQALAMDPRTKACVHFARHNLLEMPFFDGEGGERFDLVFCRNVLVYFAPLAAALAIEHMRAAMKPGAWLVLGNMDLGSAPAGFGRVGPSALCVYAKEKPLTKALPTDRPQAAPPAAAPAVKPTPLTDESLDPVEWHRAILAEMETGHAAQALQELQLLVEAHPAYLPGRFEHALALRRSGRSAAATASLQALMDLATGRDLDERIAGPEPLSLEFYVNSAHSFLESAGGRP